MTPSESPPEVKRPRWKDPFVLAFVIGVVVLTVLPFLQGRFLKAPPALRALPPWSFRSVNDGGVVGVSSLAGQVVLMELVGRDCDAGCVERQRAFGRGLEHTDDLGDKVQLVTVALPGAEAELRPLEAGRWHVASGSAAEVGSFLQELRVGWADWAHTDAGTTADELAQLPAVVLIDQFNQLRGFWRDDPAGRGNAINAARLLAKHPDVAARVGP